MKVAIAQINTTVGDIRGNTARVLERINGARQRGIDLVIFPELTITGYPPRDLLEIPAFVDANIAAVRRIARQTRGIGAVVGFVSRNAARTGRALYNSAALLADGRLRHCQHKTLLPNYDVFDEARHFAPAPTHRVAQFRGYRLGLSLCEDAWFHHELPGGRRLYAVDPIARLCRAGADLLINCSASPFTVGKSRLRRDLLCRLARRCRRPICYANLVGGNDELVFDGKSCVVDARGRIVAMGAAFAEDELVIDCAALAAARPCPVGEPPTVAQAHAALVLGLRDYCAKCGFSSAVIGLSGGIDSAVVAAIAVEALGAQAVRGLAMPSPYSSPASVTDAQAIARNLGMACEVISITPIYEAFRRQLQVDAAAPPDLADENLQARIRGVILMTCSNRTGALVLSTGNKSELAVGYCTIYGDMVGGLALLSDIPKTMVYALARFINARSPGVPVIPAAILSKPPSAELRPGQTDQETLPPYEVLDAILAAYIEEQRSVDQIVRRGNPRSVVEAMIERVHRNEYKRRQAAPGFKITAKAFGMGRRFPIACRVAS